MTVKWITGLLGSGIYCWWPLDASNRTVRQGALDQMIAEIGSEPVAILWPAERSCLHEVQFGAQERKHLRKTLPYTLEESLAVDVDELHFSLSKLDMESVAVAVVDREEVDMLLEEFGQHNIEVACLWPEQLVIPWSEEHWTLWQYSDLCLVRHARSKGFAVELETLPLALQLLQDEVERLPESVDLYCPESSKETLFSSLPQTLQSYAQWHGEASLVDINSGSCAIDFLQGDYGRKVAWGEVILFWRWPALLLLLLVGLKFGYAITENLQLNQQHLQLQGEIERAFRSAIPEGVMAEPELQLRRLVKRGQNGAAGNVLGFIHQIGTVLKNSNSSITLKNATYNELQDEFQLSILADAFSEVESFREALQSSDLQAELVGTSIENKRTLARLRVRRPL